MDLQLLPSPENQRHYPSLNGLRGLLVLGVFAGHYGFIRSDFFDPAAWAVHCFFVLSGFLITGILFDTRNAENRWSAFYARRTLRIFPLYYGCLLVILLLEPVCRWVVHPSQFLWPLYLSNYSRLIWPQDVASGVADHFVSGRFHFTLFFGHFWTLCIEEQFYLLWPLVVFCVRDRKRLMAICAAAVILVPVLRTACQYYLEITRTTVGFVDRVVFLQSDALLLGALFALWYRGAHFSLRKLSLSLFAFVMGLGAFNYFFLFHSLLIQNIHHLPGAIYISAARSVANLFGLACVLLGVEPYGKWQSVLTSRFLYWLGTISYGFYVFHDIPHVIYVHAVKNLPISHTLAAGILGFACTLALAALSFRYFETPFLKLKKYFVVRRKTSA